MYLVHLTILGLILTSGGAFLPLIVMVLIAMFATSFSIWMINLINFITRLKYATSTRLRAYLFITLIRITVIVLRPVTLTLRVYINITIGHVALENICEVQPALLWVMIRLELFVYVVQSFVYLTLINSYIEE